MRITWNEPTECTPRGWAILSDAEAGACCGFYLAYSSPVGPAGEPILARAYLFRVNERTRVYFTQELGSCYFWTAENAKQWVERAVALALEADPMAIAEESASV